LTAGRILVIAPDQAYRHSLAFALEAEGHAVTELAALPLGPVFGQDVVVLDHKAASGLHEAVLAFCRGGAPVVLLAGQPQHWLAGAVFGIVSTPIRGAELADAVALAMGAARPPQDCPK
jgi:hypothetical protein